MDLTSSEFGTFHCWFWVCWARNNNLNCQQYRIRRDSLDVHVSLDGKAFLVITASNRRNWNVCLILAPSTRVCWWNPCYVTMWTRRNAQVNYTRTRQIPLEPLQIWRRLWPVSVIIFIIINQLLFARFLCTIIRKPNTARILNLTNNELMIPNSISVNLVGTFKPAQINVGHVKSRNEDITDSKW